MRHAHGGPWRPSEIQRSYRALLDSAKEEAQVIVDTDKTQLLLEERSKAEFRIALIRRLGEIAQFHAAYARNRESEPAEWAAQTPYPWLAAFSRQEADEFASELLAYALDAVRSESMERFEGNLAAWRSTAEIYDQPEIIERMLASIKPAEIVELLPPEEDEPGGSA